MQPPHMDVVYMNIISNTVDTKCPLAKIMGRFFHYDRSHGLSRYILLCPNASCRFLIANNFWEYVIIPNNL